MIISRCVLLTWLLKMAHGAISEKRGRASESDNSAKATFKFLR